MYVIVYHANSLKVGERESLEDTPSTEEHVIDKEKQVEVTESAESTAAENVSTYYKFIKSCTIDRSINYALLS